MQEELDKKFEEFQQEVARLRRHVEALAEENRKKYDSLKEENYRHKSLFLRQMVKSRRNSERLDGLEEKFSLKRILLYLTILGTVAGLFLRFPDLTSTTGGAIVNPLENPTVSGAIVGFLFGLGTALTGLFKNRKKPNFLPSGKKALPTAVITALAGAYAGASGMPLNQASLATAMSGFTAVGLNEWLNNLLKGLKNHLIK